MCEQIKALEERLENATALGLTSQRKSIEAEIVELRKQLSAVNKILSEGSSILKG